MGIERGEYISLAKQKALSYLDDGDVLGAVKSLTLDLRAHPDTREAMKHMGMSGILAAASGDKRLVRTWIDGFN